MAAVTISTNTNLDDRVFDALVSNDLITINNGASLIINSDVVDASSSFSPQNVALGSITINDGAVIIDGTQTREVPFYNMTGSVWGAAPVYWGATGSITGTTGSLIGLFFSVTGSATGVAKFRGLSGSFQKDEGIWFNSASYTYTATASSADSSSWLLVAFRETATITTTRQASFIVTGSWYQIGTGSNIVNQPIEGAVAKFLTSTISGSGGYNTTGSTCPLQGSYPAIWVERTAGTEIYDIWLNPGSGSQVHSGSFLDGIDDRGMYFFHPNQARFLTASYKQASNPLKGNPVLQNCKIKVPNIHIISSAATGKPTSSYNATITNWVDFTTTAAGTIDIRNCSGHAFYPSLGQSYNVTVKDSGITGAILATETGNACYIENVGIGQTSAVAGVGFNFTSNYGSTTLKNSKAVIPVVANATTPCLQIISCNNVIVTGSSFHAHGKTGTSAIHINISNATNVTMSQCNVIGAKAIVQNFSNYIYFKDLFVANSSASLDATANFGVSGLYSSNIKFDGLRWPRTIATGSASPPNGGLFEFNSCNNIEFKNMGTIPDRVRLFRGDQLFSTSDAYAGYVLTLTAANTNVKMSRCHFTGSRTGFINTNNSNDTVLLQNCSCDFDDQLILTNRNQVSKAIRSSNGQLGNTNGVATAATLAAVYGTHFYDVFITDVSGSIGIVSTEQTSNVNSTGSYFISGSTTITGSPVFNSNGGVLLRESGSYVEWVWPYYIYGHEGFSSQSINIAATNPLSVKTLYAIDPGTGVFGTYKDVTSSSLAGESISPTTGFKLKTKVIATGSNPNTQINAISFNTRTSLASQTTSSLYPIDTTFAYLTLTGLISGSEIRVYQSGSGTELAGVENSGTTFSYGYTWSGTDYVVSIVIVNVTYEYLRYDNITLGSGGLTIPIQQRFDRNYKNPP